MTEIAGDGEYASVYAWGINNHGQVVGSREMSSGLSAAFLWQNGVTLNLGRLPGADDAGAGRINDAGVVTGISGERPFLWESGVMRDFSMFPGGTDFRSAIMNNQRVIAGTIQPATTGPIFRHAAVWIDGQARDLGDLPGGSYNLYHEGNYSAAFAINDLGQVVGRSDGANGYNAFLWSNGVMTDLGALPGFGRNFSEANDINNWGVIVGSSGFDHNRAFVWDSVNGMSDLNSLLDESGTSWLLTTANAINNHGQIVGAGYLDGHLRGFILTPVPEPATISTAIVALACAIIIAARQLFRKGAEV